MASYLAQDGARRVVPDQAALPAHAAARGGRRVDDATDESPEDLGLLLAPGGALVGPRTVTYRYIPLRAVTYRYLPLPEMHTLADRRLPVAYR